MASEEKTAGRIVQEVFNHSEVINGKVFIQDYDRLIKKVVRILKRYHDTKKN